MNLTTPVKTIAIATLLSVGAAAPARAEVMEVNIWKPLAGVPSATQKTIANGKKAQAISTKHGAQVSVASDFMGNMHYAIGFKDWAAWNAYWGSKLGDPKKEWQNFMQGAAAEPTAERIAVYLLDIVAPGKGGQVFEVYVWEALPGRVNDLIEAGVGAKPIHEKSGLVNVSVGVDRLSRMHYIMQYASWENYAKFHDTPNPEFQAYMAEQNKDPGAKLIKVYTGSED